MGDNPYYRPYGDPSVLRGFDDLAKAFAPLSAQEVFAGVKAQEGRQKMQSIADYYRTANDPNVDPRKLDIYGVGANLYNPTAGFVARDMHSADTRRGQDLGLEGTKYSANASAGAARYGHDLSYKANVYHTDVDAGTKVRGQDVDADTKLKVALSTPMSTGQVRTIPPDVASLYKVPGQQTGIVETKPGEKQFLPDGRVIEGNVKAPTLEEAKGAQFGSMTPDERNAIVFGQTPVEVVPGAPGQPGTPATRPQVLAGGKAPVDTKHAPQLFNYKTLDNKTGMGTIENGVPVDATTRQPLPQGTAGQALSGVQGKDPLGATTANVTEGNRKAAQLDVMDKSLTAYETLLRNNPGIVGIPGSVRGVAQNAVSVAEEFAGAFGKLSPMAKMTEDQVKQVAAQIGGLNRDPAIAQARVLEADLAYKWAQMQNPSGEVSRQAFERGLEVVTGGSLRNNQSALEAITAMRQALGRERGGADALRHPGGQGSPQAAPVPAARPRFQNPQTGETIEWDGQNYVPVK